MPAELMASKALHLGLPLEKLLVDVADHLDHRASSFLLILFVGFELALYMTERAFLVQCPSEIVHLVNELCSS